MSQIQTPGITLTLDDEGFLTQFDQWNREVAAALAQAEGIQLTDAHWRVLDFLRKDYQEKQTVPGMRRLNKVGGIPTKELYALFPDGPIKRAARIAGCPKPTSCV